MDKMSKKLKNVFSDSGIEPDNKQKKHQRDIR